MSAEIIRLILPPRMIASSKIQMQRRFRFSTKIFDI